MKDGILEILRKPNISHIEKYKEIIEKYFIDDEQAALALQNIVECTSFVANDEVEELGNLQIIEKTYKRIITDLVWIVVDKNLPINDFYNTIYSEIFKNSFYPQDINSKSVYIKILSEDIPILPYYFADSLVKMTDNEYKENIDRIKPSIQKAIHMLNRHFDSYTEIASELIAIQNKLEGDSTNEIVYWATVLSAILNRKKQ